MSDLMIAGGFTMLTADNATDYLNEKWRYSRTTPLRRC